MEPIYLDHAATTPLRAEVRAAMLPLLEGHFGNPSSVHRWGRAARALRDDARARLAAVLGAEPAEIVFTRGGTEADNLAVLGRARALPGAVVCSAVEHKAVLASAEAAGREAGTAVHHLPVGADGVVRDDALDALLAARPAVVSVMWVNNETGAVQPVERIAARCRAAGVAFHTDAVQAFGKLRVRVDEVPVDLLAISAHKIGGPKGVGALYVRRGTALAPLVHGGMQEGGLRAGTEDVIGAVALATAAEFAAAEREATTQRLGALRDRLEVALRERVPELVVHAAAAPRVATTSSVSVPGADPGMLLPALDAAGIAVSSGSACRSGATQPSHVLLAMGVPPEVAGPAVRFSLGHETTAAEIERVIDIFPGVVEQLRELAA
ncbi:MAG TPA: cysteine desulfurase family protein [Longimicrobiaceae bacterium]|nr:cysteine desulfurase family protein [Longimicrobiaceae bacterium]